MLVEDDLRKARCQVLGPFGTLDAATRASRRELFDLAVLDVNLNGQMVSPLAAELVARDMPVLLLSGYGVANLPVHLRGLPRLMKPHDPATLMQEIRRIAAEMRDRPDTRRRDDDSDPSSI